MKTKITILSVLSLFSFGSSIAPSASHVQIDHKVVELLPLNIEIEHKYESKKPVKVLNAHYGAEQVLELEELDVKI